MKLSSSQVPFLPTQGKADSDFIGNTPHDRKERRKWTPSDDMLLISSWLNTSKDAVVNNEQKLGAFWSRVAAYFSASQVSGGEHREANNCKHRWHKINEQVCKFCGAYEAATREISSGQNENDVELRNDQKWCELSSSKNAGSSKKRKVDEDGADCSSSQPTETMRPEGVKAAKARGKKTVVEENARKENAVKEFQSMVSLKQQDLVERVHGSGAVVNDWSRE
ncbi:PREDICTED: glutathione S-transferase T3-like [Brassica oleracea var. oleracea]|uniref:glutathione S-transferase T3-like n=1 Tax=Brassica oleracea var. oleracea TaxID=109376 RepID=UPI0006A6D2FC|nr:PREDICTED: glutathione S-transferase T3-like [Brassica oleracea var. oleracea]